jgi:hypothetical protein
MPIYAFAPVRLHCDNQRGKLPDDDLITFSVFVNQVARSTGAGMFPAITTGTDLPVIAGPPQTRNLLSSWWVAGPLDIDPNDSIAMVYSCYNTSDSQLTDIDAQQLQIKLLDAITAGVAGAVTAGVLASAISAVLGALGDPIGKFLGWSPQGPCNGLIFEDTVQFTGANLGALAFGPRQSDGSQDDMHLFNSYGGVKEFQITRPYSDEATHNSDTCGEVAHYHLTVSVFQVPAVSVKSLLNLYHPGTELLKGVRQLFPGQPTMSLKSLVHLRP